VPTTRCPGPALRHPGKALGRGRDLNQRPRFPQRTLARRCASHRLWSTAGWSKYHCRQRRIVRKRPLAHQRCTARLETQQRLRHPGVPGAGTRFASVLAQPSATLAGRAAVRAHLPTPGQRRPANRVGRRSQAPSVGAPMAPLSRGGRPATAQKLGLPPASPGGGAVAGGGEPARTHRRD
jgi:hypothetical protein